MWDANEVECESRQRRIGMTEKTGMTEREARLAREREEIAARVASFRATLEKFRREREEYFATTMESARYGRGSRLILERTPRWP